jgi:hypothetical protein
VYIGPNLNGNAATRMEADGTNPSTVYFSFEKDTGTAAGAQDLSGQVNGAHSAGATILAADQFTTVPPEGSLFTIAGIAGTTFEIASWSQTDGSEWNIAPALPSAVANNTNITVTTWVNNNNDGMRNTATTRDGGTAVPPYVTIGHSGCTRMGADLATGCGPDNEDGRGVFNVGTIGTNGYIFLGGARSNAGFDYVYYSADTDVTLDYKYIDMGTITGTATQGMSAIAVFGDRVYVGMAKLNYSGKNAPDFGRINFTASTGEGTECTPGSNCNASDGTAGKRMYINCVDRFGGTDSGTTQTLNNYAYYVGVDALYVYKNQLYAANGGHNQADHNGGVIRSTSTFPAAYNNNNCTGGGWTLITPSAAQWHNSNARFSIELTKIADLIPQDKAVAGFAEFNNNLYMIRNSCSVANDSRSSEDAAAHTTAGCTDGTFGNRQPQLWKCVPGGDNVCDPADWTLIDSGSGITNMGVATNHSITMIVTNGSRLYIGFDSTSGVQIWRTKSGVTNPTSGTTTDFEQVATDGLGDPTNIREIYSAISIQSGSDYYIYLSSGKNATPVSVYRQINQ